MRSIEEVRAKVQAIVKKEEKEIKRLEVGTFEYGTACSRYFTAVYILDIIDGKY